MRGVSWSELGASWSKGSEVEQGEQAGVSWEQAGVRGVSWSELGASWEQAGVRGASWE